LSKGKSSDLLFNPDHQFTKKIDKKKSSKQLKIYFLRRELQKKKLYKKLYKRIK
jgi:hypothetical protein